MPTKEIPEPWQTWMRRAGLHNVRQLALAGQMNYRTASRAVHALATPTDETVNTLATTLGVPAADVYRASHVEPGTGTPWTPPAEAARMTHRQRRAAEELIRAMVDATDRIPGRNGTPDWSPAGTRAGAETLDPETLGLAAHTPTRPAAATQHENTGEEPQA